MTVRGTGPVTTSLRILYEVALYRLKRMEMANLLAGLSIALALGLPLGETVVRGVFLLLLNVLALLGNDCLDVDQDMVSPQRDPAKPRFLKDHMREAVWTQVILGLMLAGFAVWWSRGLLVALVLGEVNCLLYSWKLKRMPFVDVLSIAIWGVVMPMACFPLDATLGWCLAGQLFFFSGAFELMQVMRDRREDTLHGVKTTAVKLGHRGSVVFQKIVLVAAAVFGILFVHRIIGIGILASLLLPIRRGEEARAWTQLRLALGIVWLLMVGWVLWTGGTDGLLASVPVEATISWMAVVR